MSFHVVTAEFEHETNTFNIHKTGINEFRDCGWRIGDEAVEARRGHNTAFAGFHDVAEKHGWTLHHALSADANPGGPVTREAFDIASQVIIDTVLARKGRLDGILLGLHGAMVTDFSPDGEGTLLDRLRAVVGPQVPIAVTIDPHAHVTARMCRLADIIISYKTNPHIDMRDTGRHAAELLQRTMAGEIRPRTLLQRVPMLEEVNAGRTDVGPMVEWIAEARRREKEANVFAVSINGGFPSADIPEIGPTVLVTYEGDPRPHLAFAKAMAGKIWANRENMINSWLTVAEAAAIARDYRGERPLVIADGADSPGSGAYGDSPALLQALLTAEVKGCCLGPIVDPEVVEILQEAAIGDEVTLALGGKNDRRFGGAPLEVTGRLLHLGDGQVIGEGEMMGGILINFGPTAVIEVAAIKILIVSVPVQIFDLQQFRAFDIDPAAHRVVALKSLQHFRAAFTPIAGRIIVCDSGALATLDYGKLPYHNVPRPIFPLDRAMSF